MSGIDPSSTGGSPATASNGNASSTAGEGGSTAADSNGGASGDTMNVVRVTGMFEIPVEQVMVVSGQSPEMTAADAVEQNRESSSGSSSSTN